MHLAKALYLAASGCAARSCLASAAAQCFQVSFTLAIAVCHILCTDHPEDSGYHLDLQPWVSQLTVRPAHSGRLSRKTELDAAEKVKIPKGPPCARSCVMQQQQVGRLHARNVGALAKCSLRDLAVAGSILFAQGSAPAPSDDASPYAQHETIKMGHWALTPRLGPCNSEIFFSVSQVSTEPCLQQYLGRCSPDVPQCPTVVDCLACYNPSNAVRLKLPCGSCHAVSLCKG